MERLKLTIAYYYIFKIKEYVQLKKHWKYVKPNNLLAM